MQYLLTIYEDEAVYGPEKNGPAMQDIAVQHMAFVPRLGAARIGGGGLAGTASATTVRTASGTKSIHDGPFAEAKEQLGGFYVIEVADLDAAIAVAKQVPIYRDGSVEIRPIRGRP